MTTGSDQSSACQKKHGLYHAAHGNELSESLGVPLTAKL
jgi:hypothetical protein